VYFWNMHDAPAPLAGAATGLGPVVDPVRFPFITVVPLANRAVLIEQNGVQNEFASWSAPLAEARGGHAKWRPLTVSADEVTAFDGNATTLYLLSHKDAPTFKVLSMALDGTLAGARIAIPARPERVIESIHCARDGLYVVARAGLAGRVLRLDAHGKLTTLKLPFEGTVDEVATDPTRAGAIVSLVGGCIRARTTAMTRRAASSRTCNSIPGRPSMPPATWRASSARRPRTVRPCRCR